MTATNEPNCFSEIRRADRNLPAAIRVIAAALEGSLTHFLPQAAKRRHENVFERWLINANFPDVNPGGAHRLFKCALRLGRLAYEKIQSVAESLHIHDIPIWSADAGENSRGFGKV